MSTSGRHIKRVIWLGTFVIAGILGLQAYWVSKSWSRSAIDFDRNVKIALINVAQNMAEFNSSILPSTDLIKRITSSYYVVNFNDAIDANVLEYYLLREFETVSITDNFEYAIYDCSSDEMVYGNFCDLVDSDRRQERTDLPKYDEFIYYFGVKFPNRTSFLLGNFWLPIIFSGITLIAVIFFIYAIFIITNQDKLSALQRDFINNMTHEFKTPISSIKISGDYFSSHPVIKSDEKLTQYAGIITEQNERLNQQVEKVLNIARLDQNNFKLQKEALDLHQLIREIKETVDPKVEALDGKLETDLKAEDASIFADSHHLKNIIFNLVDNAIKYSNGKPEVKLSTSNSNGSIVFTVSDKGIGIPKTYQKHLFKKFFRVPKGNVHDVKGFGLGLHYVKKIADQHRWRIQVNSEENKGTQMNIFIPN